MFIGMVSKRRIHTKMVIGRRTVIGRRMLIGMVSRRKETHRSSGEGCS